MSEKEEGKNSTENSKKNNCPLAGKQFDEITADDIVALIKKIRSVLPAPRKILAAAAGLLMLGKFFKLIRLACRKKELKRLIEEEGMKAVKLNPEKAVHALQKKRYRRYMRNRRVLNILASKKTRKSPGYRKFIQVMDELHPKIEG